MRRHTPRAARLRRLQPPRRSPARRPLPTRLRFGLRSALWWGPSALALLVLAVVLSGASAPTLASDAAHAHAARPFAGRAVPPAALPETARWQDFTDNTAYSVHTKSSATPSFSRVTGNLFTFTAPTGDQVLGVLPLVRQNDLSYVQTTSDTPAILSGCARGVLTVSQPSVAASREGAPARAPVEYALRMHFDQYGLVAYAEILYAPVTNELAASAVCKGAAETPGTTHLLMSAGCDATSCTSPLDTAAAAPPQYEGALLGAMNSRSQGAWEAVYNQTSHLIAKQFRDVGQFTAMMNSLVDHTGRMTAASVSGPAPQVQFDVAGQAYYTVVEHVTVQYNGKTTTEDYTSYYLLESGKWVFWFSLPPS